MLIQLKSLKIFLLCVVFYVKRAVPWSFPHPSPGQYFVWTADKVDSTNRESVEGFRVEGISTNWSQQNSS